MFLFYMNIFKSFYLLIQYAHVFICRDKKVLTKSKSNIEIINPTKLVYAR